MPILDIPELEVLQTVRDISATLGARRLQELCAQKSENALSRWHAENRIPARHYVIVQDALARMGKTAAPGLFGMKPLPAKRRVEPANG